MGFFDELKDYLVGQANKSAKTKKNRTVSNSNNKRRNTSTKRKNTQTKRGPVVIAGPKNKNTNKNKKNTPEKKQTVQRTTGAERQKELLEKRRQATSNSRRRQARQEASEQAKKNLQEVIKETTGNGREVKEKLKPDEREYTGANAKSMNATRNRNKQRRDAIPKAQEEIAERPAVLGFYNAANPLPVDIDEHFATKEARDKAKKSKDTTAYKVSYGVTTAGGFLTGAGAGNAVTKNVLKNTAKAGAKKAVKRGPVQIAKAKGKEVVKTTGKATIKKASENTKAQKFVAGRVGDFVGSTPLNLKEAVKEGRQEDGSFDEKKAVESFAKNTALDFAVGGALEGAIAGAKVLKTKADANKFIKIKAKKDAGGKLTAEEQRFYTKAMGELQDDYVNKAGQKAVEEVRAKYDKPQKNIENTQKSETISDKTATGADEIEVPKTAETKVEEPKTAEQIATEAKQKNAKVKEQISALEKERAKFYAMAKNTKNVDHRKEYLLKWYDTRKQIDDLMEANGIKNIARPSRETAQKAEDLTQAAKGEHAESLKELTSGNTRGWDNFRRVFVDTFHGFEKYANQLPKEARDTFRSQINAMRNAKNKAGGWLSEARVDANGKVIGKSFKSIMGDMLQAKNAQKYDDFQYYIANKHNIDRYAQGKGVFGDTITSDDSKAICDALEKQYPDFIKKQEELTNYFKDLQQFRVDTGLVEKSTADYLDAIYPNYIPTYRVVDGQRVKILGQDSNTVKVGDPIKKATGSDAELIPLHQQVINLTEYTMKMGEQNRLFNMVATTQGFDVKAIDPSVKLDDAIEACTFTSKETDGATNKYFVSFYDNGQLKKMQITDQMYHGIREWRKDPESLAATFNWRAKTVRGVNNTFKNLITGWNPIFGVKNIVKDTGEALLYTKNVKGFIASYPKAIAALTKDSKYSKYFDLYQASGGKYSHIRDDIATFDIEKTWKKVVKSPIELCQRFNDTLEAIPRLAEFISTIDNSVDAKAIYKAGGSVNDVLSKMNSTTINKALLNANEVTLNFGRSGVAGKFLNSTVVPYLNPAIQGLDKLARTFRDAGRDGVKGMLGLFAKIGTFAIAPAAFNEMMNMGNKDYQNLNARDQDNNYMIPMGDGKFIKIPKSRVGAALSTPITHVMRYAEYGDSIEWKEMFMGMWSNVGVMNPLDSSLFSPVMLAMTNKTWYGGNIESAKDLDLRAVGKKSEIFDETTSAIGIWIGDKFNMSPKKVDYIIDAYTGVIGDFLLPATAEASFQNPMYKNFIVDSVFSNKLATEFWEKNADLEAYSNVYGEEKTTEYDNWKSNYMYDAMTINQAITDIDSDKNLTKAQKLEMKRELRKTLNKFYKAGTEGSEINIEPVSIIAKQIGADKALSNYLPDKGSNNFKEFYKEYKKLEDYSNKNSNGKQKIANNFLRTYKLSVETQKQISVAYHNTPNWMTIAVANASLGNSDNITKACGVYEDSIEKAKTYINNLGGTVKKYIATEKQINNEIEKLKTSGTDIGNSLFKRNIKSGASALALAKGKVTFYDRAYYISGTESKMNAARGLEKKYNWTIDEVSNLGLSADSDKNTYLKKDEVISAIEGSKAKDLEEKAMLFNLLMGDGVNNPYGSIGDYSLNGDVGVPSNNSSGSYSGRSRGSRSSGGSSSGTEQTWEEYLDEVFGKDRSKLKTSSVSSNKSALNDAYRKKVGKLVENMRV